MCTYITRAGAVESMEKNDRFEIVYIREHVADILLCNERVFFFFTADFVVCVYIILVIDIMIYYVMLRRKCKLRSP